METLDPIREKLRRDSDEPSDTKSKTETELPKRNCEKTAKFDPKRPKLRRDKEDPTLAQSRRESEDPSRAIP